jgi:hypothetical protein
MIRTTVTQPHTQPSARPYVQPSAAWTFWTTFLFGLFGLIPMFVHRSEAQNHGLDGSRYVKAFLWGLVPAILLSTGVALAIMATVTSSQ